LVALRMPRALEVLDATLRRIEQGEIGGIEALDQLLVEERTVRGTGGSVASSQLACWTGSAACPAR
jgi:hypothetical protein